MPVIILYCTTCLLSLLSSAAHSSEQAADTIYLNGRVYTANAAQPWAEVVAVRGNNIVYVGDAGGGADFTGQQTKKYDLAGRLVLPGLIDAHTHPGWIAMTSQHMQLAAASNPEQLLKSIEAMVQQQPQRDVLIAMPWGNDLFAASGPNKAALDKIESERPLLIWDDWMHSLWVNSKALEVAGVDRTVTDPVPGFSFYQRDADGELTGYITEGAATEFWGRFETLTPASEAALLEFLQYMSSQGVTTLFDAGNFGVDQQIYEVIYRLDQQGKLPLRYRGSYTLYLPQDLDEAIPRLKAMRKNFASDRLQVDTLKVFLDGVIETRTAHMLADYLDTPGNRGEALLSRQQLHQLILGLEAEGLHLHFHTVGNQATRTALDAIADAHKSLGRAPSIRIALSHLEVMDKADAARFRKLGVIAQFTPHWHGGSSDGSYENSIGELENTMFLTHSLVSDGAVVSFSSDAYFTSDWEAGNASPFTGIQVGHTRQYVEDGPAGAVAAPASEALSRQQMIAGYTRGGAYQLGLEDQLGTLVAGKKADFIVLDRNLFEVDAYTIHSIKADAVILDGKIVSGGLE